MNKPIVRSVATVVLGSLVAFLGLALSAPMLLFVAGQFSPAYIETHYPAIAGFTYAAGGTMVAIVSGVAVGVLAPSRPAVHALTSAVMVIGISAGLAGANVLPRAWQLGVLLLQCALMSAVAVVTWSRQGDWADSHMRPVQRVVAADGR